jgi:hypothetical protein
MIRLKLPSFRDSHSRLTGVMMSNLYWLTDAQMDRLRPFFPRAMANRGSMTGGCSAG